MSGSENNDGSDKLTNGVDNININGHEESGKEIEPEEGIEIVL